MERSRPPRLTNKGREEAKRFGGTDVDDWEEYVKPDQLPSHDKGGHKERSNVNQPSHLKHWKKEGK